MGNHRNILLLNQLTSQLYPILLLWNLVEDQLLPLLWSHQEHRLLLLPRNHLLKIQTPQPNIPLLRRSPLQLQYQCIPLVLLLLLLSSQRDILIPSLLVNQSLKVNQPMSPVTILLEVLPLSPPDILSAPSQLVQPRMNLLRIQLLSLLRSQFIHINQLNIQLLSPHLNQLTQDLPDTHQPLPPRWLILIEMVYQIKMMNVLLNTVLPATMVVPYSPNILPKILLGHLLRSPLMLLVKLLSPLMLLVKLLLLSPLMLLVRLPSPLMLLVKLLLLSTLMLLVKLLRKKSQKKKKKKKSQKKKSQRKKLMIESVSKVNHYQCHVSLILVLQHSVLVSYQPQLLRFIWNQVVYYCQ